MTRISWNAIAPDLTADTHQSTATSSTIILQTEMTTYLKKFETADNTTNENATEQETASKCIMKDVAASEKETMIVKLKATYEDACGKPPRGKKCRDLLWLTQKT